MFVQSRRVARRRSPISRNLVSYSVGWPAARGSHRPVGGTRGRAALRTDQNRALFELEALKSELMVVATDCHKLGSVTRFHPEVPRPQLANRRARVRWVFQPCVRQEGPAGA